MTSQERIKALLNFQIPDRIAKADGFWKETVERWHTEGLPEGQSPEAYFGLNEFGSIWVDLSFRFKEEILDETDEYTILRNEYGVTRKLLKRGSGWTPHDMDFAVKDWRSWEEHKPLLQASEDRIAPQTKETYRRLREEGRFITYGMPDPYEKTQGVIGQVALLTKMAEDPAFIRDIFETHTTLMIQMCQMLMDRGIVFDGAWLNGDIAYKNGMLFSPSVYREILMPSHKRLFDFFNAHDMPVIYHTDGDIREAIPLLLEAGVRCLQPLEAKAGMDVRRLKEEYGDRLAFMGNIDTRVMSTGDRQLIEEEVRSKITVAKQGGGYIYHSDHSVPPSVSFESYRWMMGLVERYGRY